ncbi:mitochondrial ribonuclease P catalytic subunit [Lutzomyia longipalpis]|uniref:mitochondrial ribonuclease P catalytic subunit n=1 Tax=Lutzomyia longipalpis TaxID=7200 RepID=UPI0024840474|nr:mitochondrial ribonuclease P catalytic subunit [Lutzomyia longipalpis]
MNFLRTVCKSIRGGQRNVSTTYPGWVNRKKLLFKAEKSTEETMAEFLETYTQPEATQWRMLRAQMVTSTRRLTPANVDATILGFCISTKKLQAAKCFVKFLEEDPEIPGANCATLTRLMRVYHAVACERALSAEEEDEIVALFEKLKSKFPVFDVNTAEGVIAGLSITSRWRECLELLQNNSFMCTPTIAAYTYTISAAFRNGEKDIALRVIAKSLRDSRIPRCSALTAWIDFCSRVDGESIEEFLQFLSFNDLQISTEVIEKIEAHLDGKGIPSWRSSIDDNGVCSICHTHLKPVQVSDEEFRRLQEGFLKDVLIRDDVFLKSNPKEVAAFQKFLSQHQPFDCIVDGLNVALSKGTGRSTEIQARNLINVVRHFSRKGQKVLVLGREHMSRWPKEQLNVLKGQAKVFLTDNLSHDDPFLLFAALSSGKHCCIVSRDLMRTHAFLLGSDELRNTFRKWQHTHQYRLDYSPGTKVIFQTPPTFSVAAHEVNNHWHVPFHSDYSPHQLDLFEIPQQWLCFSLSGNS